MLRGVAILSTALIVAFSSGCSAPPQPPPPDPFTTVAQRSVELKGQGEELVQQGRTREALDAFQKARLLSPTDDPELDSAIDRLSAEVAPTPVPVPPTATPVPATATPLPATPTLKPVTPTPRPQPTLVSSPTSEPSPVPLVPLAPTAAPPRPAQPVAPSRPVSPAVVYVPVPVAAPPPALDAPQALVIRVMGGPSAVTVDTAGVAYVADRSGLIWTLDRVQPTLRRPYTVAGEPMALVSDPESQRLFVAVRAQPAIVVLDSSTGQQVASVPVSADPVDLQLDPALGLLFATVPERDSIERIDTRSARLLDPIPNLDHVTGMALDAGAHTLYVSELDGALLSIDTRSGTMSNRLSFGGVGLAGLATSSGRVYAINTPGQELLTFDPATGELARIGLDAPPNGVIIGSATGAVYVLEPAAEVVVRLDPNTGAESGRMSLGDAHVEEGSLEPDQLWPRPRIAINPTDETVFVVGPSAGVVVRLPPVP